MMERGSNVRHLDWEAVEPGALTGSGDVVTRVRFWQTWWFVALVYLLAGSALGWSVWEGWRASALEQGAVRLEQFARQVRSLENEPGDESRLGKILREDVGFQHSEAAVRRADAAVAREVGTAWTSVRRDALVPLVDIENLRRARQSADEGRRVLADGGARAREREWWGLSVTVFALGLAFLASVGAVSRRGTTLVVQSLVERSVGGGSGRPDLALGARETLAGLLAESDLPVARFGNDGTVTHWSAGMEKLTGHPASSAVGREFLELVGWHEIGEVARTTFYGLFGGKSVDGVEWRYRHPSGAQTDLRASLYPERGSTGAVVGATVFLEDVSLVKRQGELLMQAEQGHRAILSALPGSILRFDAQGRLLEAVDNSGLLAGRGEAAMGLGWAEMLGAEFVAALQDGFRESRVQHRATRVEYSGRLAGQEAHVEARLAPCGLGETLVVLTDVRDRRLAAEAEARSERRFRELIEGASDVVAVVRESGHLLYASPATGPMLGIEAEVLTGKSWIEVVWREDREAAVAAWRSLMAQPGGTVRVALRLVRADGSACPVEINARNLLGRESVEAVILTVRDVSERLRLEGQLKERLVELERTNAELQHALECDLLTGAKNHQASLEYLGAAVAHVGAGGECAVAMVDIDSFKAYNLRHGYSQGDEVLRALGRAIRGACGESDVFGRYGGEEFLWLMPEVSLAEAEERVLVARRSFEALTAGLGRVRASGVVVSVRDAGGSVDGVLGELSRRLAAGSERVA